MASIFALIGTTLGFFCAVAGYLFLDVGLFSALALWAASGPASAIIAVLASFGPFFGHKSSNQPQWQADVA